MTSPIYPLIGILGGTFNPIHFGHLRMAQELIDILGLSQIRFIPSATPPHKTLPSATAIQRAEMVRLAIADNPKFILDDRELHRAGKSYTIDTLISLHHDYPDARLCLIMGDDAFSNIDTWQRWQALRDYCHIILVNRPSHEISLCAWEVLKLLEQCLTKDKALLGRIKAGLIFQLNIPTLDISSSYLRQLISVNRDITYLTTPDVEQYIKQKTLYQNTQA